MSQTFFEYGAELRIKKTNQLMKLHKLLNWNEIRRELKGLKRYEENNSSGARIFFRKTLREGMKNLS